jgi:hypothetical protein
LLERRFERRRQSIFRRVEIADEANQRRENAAALFFEDSFDVGRAGLHDRPGESIARTVAGRRGHAIERRP